eukprot:6763063-Alexandrium_andersonii.AAC.1
MPRPIHAWGCLADPLQGWPDPARLHGDPQHLGEPREVLAPHATWRTGALVKACLCLSAHSGPTGGGL